MGWAKSPLNLEVLRGKGLPSMLEAKEPESIRRYLLGESPEDERTQIEQRLLTDADFLQEILIGEVELIDAYVGNQLSESETQAFLTHFLSTADRQRQLRFARSLKKYIGNASETLVDEEPAAQSSDERSRRSIDGPIKKRHFFSFFPARSPILSYSLAALILLAVAGVSWLAIKNWRTPQTGSGNVLAVTLTPGLTRAGGEVKRIKLSPEVETVEFRLELQKSDYPIYRSVLQADNKSEVWTSGELVAANDSGTSFVVAGVPANLLVAGDYRVQLSGVRSGDSSFEDIATYSLRVLR